MAASHGKKTTRAPYDPARRRALRLLATCSRGRTISPKSLHRLRSTLRRLQAWLEVIGRHEAADHLAREISRTSRLRSLQVFEDWLRRTQAPQKDLRRAADALREERARLAHADTFAAMRTTINAIRNWEMSDDLSPTHRIWTLYRQPLAKLLRKIRHNPKRKRLHQLRLQLKLFRYTVEWAEPRTSANRELIGRLKRSQRCLGAYEDLAAFRRLAKRWNLSIRPRINSRWRKARQFARAEARHMSWLTQVLERQHEPIHARVRTTHPRREPNPASVNADLTSR